jgi:tetratricopeptide (TPR) repeat protein
LTSHRTIQKRKLLSICIICLTLFQVSFLSFSQQEADSLKSLLNSTKSDTLRLYVLNDLAKHHSQRGEYDKAHEYASEIISLSGKLLSSTHNSIEIETIKKNMGNAYNQIGYVFESKGNYPEALKNYFSSLEIRMLLNNKKNIAGSLGNIGNVYFAMGNYAEALKHYLKSLKIREEIGDKRGIANMSGNIGNLYYMQGNYEDAIKNHHSALKIREEIGDKQGLAYSYAGIGAVYATQKKFKEAIENHNEAIRISADLSDKRTLADEYNNLGVIYNHREEFDLALEKYKSSLELRNEMGDTAGIASSFINIGDIYIKMKNLSVAHEYLRKGLDLSLKTGNKDLIRSGYHSFTQLDSAKGDFRNAISNFKKYLLYRDSLNNEESTRKIVKAQMIYEFEKKEQVSKAEQEKKDMIMGQEKRKQKTTLTFIICGLLLVFLFTIFIYRSYLQKRKANIEITKQKELIEEKQKEIMDSIHYARRIQRSLLPTEKYIQKKIQQLKKS